MPLPPLPPANSKSAFGALSADAAAASNSFGNGSSLGAFLGPPLLLAAHTYLSSIVLARHALVARQQEGYRNL